MISIPQAKEAFLRFLSRYDMQNDKIRLKAVHTFQVMTVASYLCLHEKLSQEDTQLAALIALLHDIGRFRQLEQTGSFDDRLFDHAKGGVRILFEEGLIAQFLPNRKYDALIRRAIACHSLYELPQGLTEQELLHCQLIRDADKLDNFRVKQTEDMRTILEVSEDQIGLEPISPNILEDVRAHRCILASTRKTRMDRWVSWLAFTFDLNFPSSFRYLAETDYINRNIDKIPYGAPNTRRDMEEIRRILLEYVAARAPQEPAK